MPSNALTSRNRLDGDVAVAVSFCVVARRASTRITRFVRGMAMVLSNDTIVFLLAVNQASHMDTTRQSNPRCPICILDFHEVQYGSEYAYWAFQHVQFAYWT